MLIAGNVSDDEGDEVSQYLADSLSESVRKIAMADYSLVDYWFGKCAVYAYLSKVVLHRLHTMSLSSSPESRSIVLKLML